MNSGKQLGSKHKNAFLKTAISYPVVTPKFSDEVHTVPLLVLTELTDWITEVVS